MIYYHYYYCYISIFSRLQEHLQEEHALLAAWLEEGLQRVLLQGL